MTRIAHATAAHLRNHRGTREMLTLAEFLPFVAAHDAVTREARRHIAQSIEETRTMERYRLEQLQQRCYEAATDRANACD